MNNRRIPKITTLILNMKIDNSVPNTLDGEPLTTPDWESQRQVSEARFLKVFASLPRQARKAIQRDWQQNPAKHPATGEQCPGPIIAFAHKFEERTAQLRQEQWATNQEGVFWFDADLIFRSPPEVYGLVIARLLALSFVCSIYGSRAFKRKGSTLEANRLAEEWGYPLLDDRIWAKARRTENPFLRFYAELFARLGYPPPPTVELDAMERIYRSEGMHELVGLLRQTVSLGPKFRFNVDPLGHEASNLLGMSEQVLHERGNACERCGASGEHRELHLHRHVSCEIPQFDNDPRAVLVLCSICLRECRWTLNVFGFSQRNRVFEFYNTIPGAADRIASLLTEDSSGAETHNVGGSPSADKPALSEKAKKLSTMLLFSLAGAYDQIEKRRPNPAPLSHWCNQR